MTRNWLLVAQLALVVALQHGFRAQASAQYVKTVRGFACGPMQLTATTVSTPDRDMYSQVLRQNILFFNRNNRVVRHLDLQQDYAREPAFANTPMVDAPAWGWSCTQSRAAQHYLIIFLNCKNPDATSCGMQMTAGPVEWSIVYDENGNALFPENRYVHEGDIKTLKQLGLYESAYERPAVLGQIFWDQKSSNP